MSRPLVIPHPKKIYFYTKIQDSTLLTTLEFCTNKFEINIFLDDTEYSSPLARAATVAVTRRATLDEIRVTDPPKGFERDVTRFVRELHDENYDTLNVGMLIRAFYQQVIDDMMAGPDKTPVNFDLSYSKGISDRRRGHLDTERIDVSSIFHL